MDKKIFQDQLPLTRRQLLEDNCTECEKITYPKDFDEQQMAERKTKLANIDIQIAELLEEKEEFMQTIKERMKPLREEHRELLGDIKRGYEEVTETCYKFVDRDNQQTAYYNAAGELVRLRPMEAREKQPGLFEGGRSTGTND